MSIVLDAGALLAAERENRDVMRRLEVAQREDIPVRTTAIVVAQVWRSAQGRQAKLARLLIAAGDTIMTSDPRDIRHLVDVSGSGARVLPC